MRLPWYQIDEEAITRGRMLGRLLKVPEAQGIGIAVEAWRWALEIAADGDFSGTIPDLESLAAAVGWADSPKKLGVEMQRMGLIATTPELRIRGLDRYKASWLKNRREGHGKDPTTRKHVPTRAGPALDPRKPGAPDPDPDPDPDQYRPTTNEAGRSVVVDPEQLMVALDKVRLDHGLGPEPMVATFEAWCKARGDEGFTVRELTDGYARFVPDPQIRSKTRSIAVFIKNCWKTRVWHVTEATPASSPATPLDAEFDKRLAPIRAEGFAYAASQLRELTPVAVAGELLQLRPRDRFAAEWVLDHYADHLRAAHLELLPPEVSP